MSEVVLPLAVRAIHEVAYHFGISDKLLDELGWREADISGRLLCVDTVIHTDGERAVHADRMHVGGSVRFLRDSDRPGNCA